MYKVHITVPNKIFVIKGRIVRSPFVAEVTEKQLNGIITKINFEGLTESQYKIENMRSERETQGRIQKKKQEIAKTLETAEKPVLVEELAPISTLDKILNGGDDE